MLGGGDGAVGVTLGIELHAVYTYLAVLSRLVIGVITVYTVVDYVPFVTPRYRLRTRGNNKVRCGRIL